MDDKLFERLVVAFESQARAVERQLEFLKQSAEESKQFALQAHRPKSECTICNPPSEVVS